VSERGWNNERKKKIKYIFNWGNDRMEKVGININYALKSNQIFLYEGILLEKDITLSLSPFCVFEYQFLIHRRPFFFRTIHKNIKILIIFPFLHIIISTDLNNN